MPDSSEESLQGWIAPMNSDADVRAAIERAFTYRGDVTITMKDGRVIEGYIFDRIGDGATLDECRAHLFPAGSEEKVSIRFSEIAGIAFTGRDPAAGTSFHTFLKKWRESHGNR